MDKQKILVRLRRHIDNKQKKPNYDLQTEILNDGLFKAELSLKQKEFETDIRVQTCIRLINSGKDENEIYEDAFQRVVEEQKQQKVVEISIIVQNQNLFDILKGFKKIQLIIQRAIEHFEQKLELKTLQYYYTSQQQGNGISLFRQIKATQVCSGGNDKSPLLPEEFKYDLIPDCVQIISSVSTMAGFKGIPEVKLVLGEEQKIQANQGDEREEVKQRRLQKRFIRFLMYFDGQRYAQIEKDDLNYAVGKIQEKFIGIEDFMKSMTEKLDLYSSHIFDSPKGILLFGPPGTGKSAITKAFCEESGMVFVTAPMAAGDLKKGIVGDSEKTVNALADRARLIPWDLCVCLIDEIDSLVPDRNSAGSSTGACDLLSVILAIQDGSKITKNLKIIASTNLLNKMDAAFLRRMEIQIFLGNPSKSSRSKWVTWKALLCDGASNYKRLQRIFNLNYPQSAAENRLQYLINRNEKEREPGIQKFIAESTINFSADSIRKLLDRFYHQILQGDIAGDDLNNDQAMKILRPILQDVSEENKIYLGSQSVVDVILKSQHVSQNFKTESLEFFYKYAQQEKDLPYLPTKRMLVNLNCGKHHLKELFQIEVIQKTENISQKQERFDRLQALLEGNIKFCHYLWAILNFSEVTLTTGANAYINNMKKNYMLDLDKLINDIKNQPGYNQMLYDGDVGNKKTPAYKRALAALEEAYDEHRTVGREDLWTVLWELGVSSQLGKHPKTLQFFDLIKEHNQINDSWLYLVLQFSMYYDAGIVKMVDSYFLQSNNAFDDLQSMTFISSLNEEMKRYTKSVLIFDLDSIAGITKQHQGFKQDLDAPSLYALEGGDNVCQFSYSLQRPQTYSMVLELLDKVSMNGNSWYIIVSSHNKVILDVMQKLNWQKSPSIDEYERREQAKDESYRCLLCTEIFSERENEKDFKCRFHTSADLIHTKKDGAEEILKPRAAQGLVASGEDYAFNFKHVCCGGQYGTKGEMTGKHVAGVRITAAESRRETQHYR